MLVNQHNIDPELGCPGSLESSAYVQRVRYLMENRPFEIKPGDRRAFRVLVHHFAHNRSRQLVDVCLDLIICQGFYCSAYHPGDYTGVVCQVREPCCSKTKLFIEFVHFFRRFHGKSSVYAVRKKDLMLLHTVLLLSRDTSEEQLLEYEDTSPEEIALIFEYQQIRVIDEAVPLSKGFNMEKLGDLWHFRRAQEIRNAHGLTRNPRPIRCFQSFADIDAIVSQLQLQNPVEFLVQAYALGLIESRLLRTMYHTANNFEQLVSLLDRTADVRAFYDDQLTNQDHARMFIAAFSHIRRLQPTWSQAMLLFLIGINVPDGWHLPCTDVEKVPEEYLDMYLNYLLVYSYRCLTKPELRIDDLELMNNLLKLPSIVGRLVERGASLFYVAHSHDAIKHLLYRFCPSILLTAAYVQQPCPMFSSLGTLLRLPQKRRELSFGDLVTDICCPVRRDDASILYDNTRMPSLGCLAARAYKLDREVTELPVGLRRMILVHQDLKQVLKPGVTWSEFLLHSSSR